MRILVVFLSVQTFPQLLTTLLLLQALLLITLLSLKSALSRAVLTSTSVGPSLAGFNFFKSGSVNKKRGKFPPFFLLIKFPKSCLAFKSRYGKLTRLTQGEG